MATADEGPVSPSQVTCPNCGASLSPPLPRNCPFCRTALAEEHDTTRSIRPGVTVSTRMTAQGFVATPNGIEAIVRQCPACGGEVGDPRAPACPHCAAPLPSLRQSALEQAEARSHVGYPASPEGLTRLQQSLDRAGVSPEMREAVLRAGPQLSAGCPSCQGPLALGSMRRGQPAVKVKLRFGKRRDPVETAAGGAGKAGAAGPMTFEVRCTRCDYRAPLA